MASNGSNTGKAPAPFSVSGSSSFVEQLTLKGDLLSDEQQYKIVDAFIKRHGLYKCTIGYTPMLVIEADGSTTLFPRNSYGEETLKCSHACSTPQAINWCARAMSVVAASYDISHLVPKHTMETPSRDVSLWTMGLSIRLRQATCVLGGQYREDRLPPISPLPSYVWPWVAFESQTRLAGEMDTWYRSVALAVANSNECRFVRTLIRLPTLQTDGRWRTGLVGSISATIQLEKYM